MQRRRELSRGRTALAKRAQEAQAIAKEDPDLLIPAIGDIHVLVIGRELEVVNGAGGSGIPSDEKLLLKRPVLAEDLHSVVAAIAHIHEVVSIDAKTVNGGAEMLRRRAGAIHLCRRGRIVGFCPVCTPVAFVCTGFRIEDDDAMVLIALTVGHIHFVRAKIHTHLRGTRDVRRVAVAAVLSSAADLKQELSCAGEDEDLIVFLAVAADPHALFAVDRDAVHLLRPLVPIPGPSPGLDNDSRLVELDDRRRGRTLFHRLTSVDEPDVIA